MRIIIDLFLSFYVNGLYFIFLFTDDDDAKSKQESLHKMSQPPSTQDGGFHYSYTLNSLHIGIFLYFGNKMRLQLVNSVLIIFSLPSIEFAVSTILR